MAGSVEHSDLADHPNKLVITNFEISRGSNKAFPDQLSRLVLAMRMQNNLEFTARDIFTSIINKVEEVVVLDVN